MRERPIIFSGPMVQAILDDSKSQTRRIVKPQPEWAAEVSTTRVHGPLAFPIGSLGQQCGFPILIDGRRDGVHHIRNPYGQPGDRLWVRETYSIQSVDRYSASVSYAERQSVGKTLADTDGGVDIIPLSVEEYAQAERLKDPERWRPSIHMPRWASRITLEITEVRVQRLQDITEEDCVAEGVAPEFEVSLSEFVSKKPIEVTHYLGFKHTWAKINGLESWENNPWVWALSFRRLQNLGKTA